jgi:hypothetical protein
MRVFQIIFSILSIVMCIVSFFVVSLFYDSATDTFSFADFNISDVSKKENDINEDKPRIKFSNVYNSKYKYYQLVGIYFVIGFIFSLCLFCSIQTRMFKRKIVDLFQDYDDVVIFFMSSIILGLVLTVTQVVIYNRVFLNTNNHNNTTRNVVVIDNK